MTTVVVADDNPLDFQFDLSGLQSFTVNSFNASQVILTTTAGTRVELDGSFGGFDGSNMPTTGTLTAIIVGPAGQTPEELSVTAFSMAIPDFRSFVSANDGGGFSAALLVGNDTFHGSQIAGNVFDVGQGDDTADGSVSGNDTADYTRATSGVTVNLGISSAQDTHGGGVDTLIGIENLVGSAYNDNLTGTSGFNMISGGAGDDIIHPLLGGGVFDGGPGFDTLSLDGFTPIGPSITINLGVTDAQSAIGLTPPPPPSTKTFTITGIEALIGSSVADIFTGDSGNNTLRGMDGNDFLVGRLGDDILDGGAGTDTASYSGAAGSVTIDLTLTTQNTGSDGIDTLISIENLVGSSFDDTLKGNSGNNALNGGLGRDVAVFSAASSAATLTHNSDGSWTVTTSADGTDTLTNIEVANFSDHAVALTNRLDYDGSGPADLLWRNTNGSVDAWLTSNTQTYAFTDSNQGIIDTSWQIAQVGDFNGDGKADILWRNTSGNTNVWLSNSGMGMTGYTGQGLGTIDNAWHIQTTGDFNGDGKTDIVWRHDDGTVNVWDSNTGGAVPAYTGFTGQGFATIDNSWIIKGAGDFDGDGHDDILWWNTNGSVNIWFSNVTGSNSIAFTGNNLGIIPTDWSIQGIGDFNGDGKADILWRNAGGDVNVWLSNTGSGFTGLTGSDLGVIGNDWTISKVGDFNGDGKADIAWRHSPDGDVNIWMSNPGYGFLGLTGQDVGQVSSDWSII